MTQKRTILDRPAGRTRQPVAKLVTNGRNGNGPVSRSTTAPLLVGYGRVSTLDQNPQRQADELQAAGCTRLFVDHGVSGKLSERPELAKLLRYLHSGDTLVVTELSRLGRSLQHLVGVVAELQERGIGFRSLREAIDTTSASGRLTFHIFCALAEFEAAMIRERTMSGLAAARARGRTGGRPTVMSAERIAEVKSMLAHGQQVTTIARVLGVSRATIYRTILGE